MAIIYSYPKISSLNGKDSFVVTDNSDNNKTKTVAWEDVLKDNNLIQNIKVPCLFCLGLYGCIIAIFVS